MKKNIYVVIALVLTGILGVVVWSLNHEGTVESKAKPIPEPLDITLDFYNQWLAAVQSTSTNPYAMNLIADTALSTDMQTKLAQSGINTTPDPVLCVTAVPPRIGAKVIYELATTSQVMVVPRSASSTTALSAIVDLVRTDTSWEIVNISCSQGEVAPESAFSFEKEGHLIKDSAPTPLDRQYWHLVFAENGVDGYTAPLFFATTSICTIRDGGAMPCATTFVEAERVKVQGSMTERGVEVSTLESIAKP